MLNNLLTVGNQVLILFVLIGIGFVLAKLRILNDAAVGAITKIVLYIVTPCAVIESFEREFDSSLLGNLGLGFLFATIAHVIAIIHAYLLIKDSDYKKERVLRFAAVFANSGYMAFPLQKALIGSIGVFYGATYVAVFNIFAWSFGLYLVSGDKKKMSPLKIIKTPGLISVVIGVGIFLLSIDLPSIISAPISHLASLNTPLPMIIIGYHLASAKTGKILKLPNVLISLAIRLVVTPLIMLGIMYLLNISGDLAVALCIAASAPVAAITTMFASTYELDTPLASSITAFSTLLSIITMPIIVGACL